MKGNFKYVIFLLLLLVFVLLFAVAGLTYYSLSSKLDDVISQQTNRDMSTDFSALDWNGNTVKLSDSLGKPTVVNFWATWCGPCKSELPAFEEMYELYGDEVDFMMVNMTDGFQETVDGVKSFINGNGYTFPVYFDTSYEAANAYGVNAIPMTLFIDSEGYIIATHSGSMSESTLEQYLDRLLGGI